MSEANEKLYGIVAEFENTDDILVAAHRVRQEGYREFDAYTPFPVHGLSEATGWKDNRVPWMIFIGGLLGCAGGYALQVWVNVFAYPMNVGGRPYVAWPNFIPVTFECTILGAVLTAVFGTLALNGLPKPYHPIFNASRFDMASKDRFFLCVEASDPMFDRDQTRDFLRSLHPASLEEVTE